MTLNLRAPRPNWRRDQLPIQTGARRGDGNNPRDRLAPESATKFGYCQDGLLRDCIEQEALAGGPGG